jgi:NAD(P)-dependent dehydrogenase (short-subunit alcohol dehydrogenase family)
MSVVRDASSRACVAMHAIVSAGGQAHAIAQDTSKPEDCEAAVKAAVDRFGALHLAVNNAGYLVDGGYTAL